MVADLTAPTDFQCGGPNEKVHCIFIGCSLKRINSHYRTSRARKYERQLESDCRRGGNANDRSSATQEERMSNIHRFVGPSRFKGFFAFVALSLAVTASVALTPTAKPRQEHQPAQERSEERR